MRPRLKFPRHSAATMALGASAAVQSGNGEPFEFSEGSGIYSPQQETPGCLLYCRHLIWTYDALLRLFFSAPPPDLQDLYEVIDGKQSRQKTYR